jgi:hypothetical protein
VTTEDEIQALINKYKRLAREATQAAADADYGANSWGKQGLEHRAKAARGVVAGLELALRVVRKNESQEENDNDNDQT